MQNLYILQECIEICDDVSIDWRKFHQSTVLVTGATGLLGALLVKSLLFSAKKKNISITVIAAVRDRNKAAHIFDDFRDDIGTKLIFMEYLCTKPCIPELSVDYIIHTAGPTDSLFFIKDPVETMISIAKGTQHILECALTSKIISMVFLSTMEIYGEKLQEIVSEIDSGYLNPLIVRNSYPQAKRFAETLCTAYAAQYDIPIKILRLTQTFGPGITNEDSRVFAQFARAVKNCSDIVLYTEGKTKRDYLHTSDAIRAILLVLLNGNNGEAYNASNSETYISIYNMACLCVKMNSSICVKKIIDDGQAKRFAKEIKITLDTKKLQNLGWKANISLEESFNRLISSLDATNK